MTATDHRSGRKRLPPEATVPVTNAGSILGSLVNRLTENFMVQRCMQEKSDINFSPGCEIKFFDDSRDGFIAKLNLRFTKVN